MEKKVNILKLVLAASFLVSLTACHKMVVGKFDEARLKETNGNSWGVPVPRPVVWGFTGIPRDCKDCPANTQTK